MTDILSIATPVGAVVQKDGMYFTPDGDGPYCTGCYDADGKCIRLDALSSYFSAIGTHSCPVCKSNYGTASAVARMQSAQE